MAGDGGRMEIPELARRATVTFRFGALAPPLREQLPEWALRHGAAAELVERIQEDADAVTRLAVRGYLTAHQKILLHRKLVKRIARLSAKAESEAGS